MDPSAPRWSSATLLDAVLEAADDASAAEKVLELCGAVGKSAGLTSARPGAHAPPAGAPHAALSAALLCAAKERAPAFTADARVADALCGWLRAPAPPGTARHAPHGDASRGGGGGAAPLTLGALAANVLLATHRDLSLIHI